MILGGLPPKKHGEELHGLLPVFTLYFLAYKAHQNSREITDEGVEICGASSNLNSVEAATSLAQHGGKLRCKS